MHASPVLVLERWLGRRCPGIHAVRRAAVAAVVEALVLGGKLTLTHLGRNLRSAAFVKHSIKRVDRLLGNAHLHEERLVIYRALAQWLLAATPRPILLVDWADCTPGHDWLMLRAAVPLGGRALPIYEEVHPLRRYNSPRTHRRFLEQLRTVVPAGCAPIVITDAGFRGPWFRDVERAGWDWIGRVRNEIKCQLEDGRWIYTTALYRAATPTPRHLGGALLSRRQPYRCQLYLVRQYHRGRGRPRKAHGQSTAARRCRKLYKDPWLLATSLPHDRGAPRRAIKLYGRRMQIEEAIRDTKDARWGFGLRYARSRRPERLEILLLIAALGTVVCWLYGLAAESRQWGRHFQANTVRSRIVLSTVFLGRQLLTSLRFQPLHSELRQTLRRLPTLIAHCAGAP
jgi:hypothetical protein